MNLGILSRQASLYSTRRLKEAAVKRGHRVQIVDPLRCVMNISSGAPAVSYRGEQLHLDAIIPRIGASITLYGMAVVHQFEMMAVYTVAQSEAIGRSRDKLHALQLLAREGLGMPVTAFARSTLDTRELIQLVGGAPLVVKLTNGTQGKGVVLAETRKAAESVIDAFRQLDANILIQEFIAEAGGSDIRALVVGSRVVAAMQRTAADGEFRSNLHRGGSARSVRLSKEERRTAVRAAKVMGLNVAGVDMLRSDRGPLLMEVNSSPGLEGIEAASGANVAEAIIEYIEDHAPASRRARQ